MSTIKKVPSLINNEYLAAYSILPKNYDYTEIENFKSISEKIHIVPIIGLPLYEELLDQVKNNNLTQANSTLLLHIYEVEATAIVYEALPFIWGHFSQVGITKGHSDNSDSVSYKDLNAMATHLKAQLEYQKLELQKWLHSYSDNFPLFIEDCSHKHVKGNTPNLTSFKKDVIDLY